MPEAPVDAFLAFDCSDGQLKTALQGESLDPQARRWFHITSFSFSLGGGAKGGASKSDSAGKAGSGHSGGRGSQQGGTQHTTTVDRTSSSAQETFPGLDIEMPMQIGSPVLMSLCAKYANAQTDEEKEKLELKGAELWVRRSGMPDYASERSKQDYFLRISLGKVTIGSYRTSIECHDTFTLHYESMTVEYWRSDPNTGRILTKAPDEDPGARFYCSCTWNVGEQGKWKMESD